MDVQVGFDGYCRLSDNRGWCPVRIVVSNEGADIDGEIQVSTTDTTDTDADVYCVPALLPGHSRKAFYVYIPADSSSARLSIQLLAEGKEVLSRQATISWLGQEEHLYGVVGGQPSAFNFLSDIAPAGGRAVVAYLELATLPPDPLGWESLDVLILSDVDTAALDSERRQALETWVSHGGHLIVGGGAGVSRTAAGIAWLLPVVPGGIKSVENLDALEEWTGVAVQPGPYAVATASMREEGEALIRQGDLILLARRPYGAGWVDFVAFDAAMNPFINWDGRVRLWQSILETRARVVVAPHYASLAYNVVSTIPGLPAPSVAQIALFLLVYIVLIGPLNYLVLRRLDRRELAWFTIPAIIAGFTILAYVTGFQLRGNRAIVHHLVAVYVPEGMDTGRASSITGIFSPKRTSYEVMAAHALVRRLSETDQSGAGTQSLYVHQEAEGSLVKHLRVDIGGVRPLIIEGYVKVPEVRADLKLTSPAGELILEGDIFNGELALSDAILLTDSGEQRLGELPAGGVVHVSLKYGQVDNGFPERIMGSVNYWGDKDLYRRYQFLEAIFPSQSWEPGQGIYLIGWAESSPLAVEIVGKPYRTSSEVLYIYSLPVELQLGPEVSISPSAIRRRVYSQAGDVRIEGDRFVLGESSEIVFALSIWPALMVSQVDTMTLAIQGTIYGSEAPTVSLWNRKTYEWEVVPIRWGNNVLPHGENYVLPSGIVLVKLETGAEQHLEVESLTITFAGRRQ